MLDKKDLYNDLKELKIKNLKKKKKLTVNYHDNKLFYK